MTKPAIDMKLTPRERLRLRRAMDSRLIDDIFGRVVRDHTQPLLPGLTLPTAPATAVAVR